MRRLLPFLLLFSSCVLVKSVERDIDFEFHERVVIELGAEGESGEMTLTNLGDGRLVLVVTSEGSEPVDLAPEDEFVFVWKEPSRMVIENETDHMGHIAIFVEGSPGATLEIAGVDN